MGKDFAVTAEAAGSSPIAPTNSFQANTERVSFRAKIASCWSFRSAPRLCASFFLRLEVFSHLKYSL